MSLYGKILTSYPATGSAREARLMVARIGEQQKARMNQAGTLSREACP